jgi:hypothetical protein
MSGAKSRVTRFGEFITLGDYWLWSFFSKITELAHILGQLFSAEKSVNKNGLGYILGDFFANSSGHPGWEERTYSEWEGNQSRHKDKTESGSRLDFDLCPRILQECEKMVWMFGNSILSYFLLPNVY